METKEYYTPTIEELFIGYECEYNLQDSEHWNYIEISKVSPESDVNCLRTPYLCKQDIIDLGFKEDFDFTPTKHLQFVKGSIWVPGSLLLDVWYDKQPFKLCLKVVENKTNIDGYDITTLFTGICKSKNELKKLMKDYLNIPI